MTTLDYWELTASDLRRFGQRIKDAALEQRIREVGIKWIEAAKERAPVGVRKRLAERHRALVGMRSAEQVERMERAKEGMAF
jgi:hypothetical protein